MNKRIALHLVVLASAAAVFTATAIAKLGGETPIGKPADSSR